MATTKSNTKEAPSKTKSTTKPVAASKSTAKSSAKSTSTASADNKKSASATSSPAVKKTSAASKSSGDEKSSARKSASDGKESAQKPSTTGKASAAGKKSGGGASKSSTSTRDHDTIRQWAEKRGGIPSMVKGTGGKKDDTGILRIDFPGYSGDGSLEEISWDEFFAKFDESKLEFLYQEQTADGKESRFNKFVSSN